MHSRLTNALLSFNLDNKFQRGGGTESYVRKQTLENQSRLPESALSSRSPQALTRWTFVGNVMSLLFNMLSRLAIAFLPRSKCLLISWLQSPSVVILEPKKIRDTKGTFHAKMGSIKIRNGMDLTEAEDIKKRWQEYTELYKKDFHDSDN